MRKIIIILLFCLLCISCDQDNTETINPPAENVDFIFGVDISQYPEIANTNPTFYDLEGNQNTFLNILKNNGINTIRLRLWVDPVNEHSGFDEVKQFSQTLKNQGFDTWLTVHYSDTWADPSQQATPAQWQGISFNQLKDSVYHYTQEVVQEMQPDYIQIGNEINSGLLLPHGHISNNPQNFRELLQNGIQAVRDHASQTEIILHYAGIDGSEWFFDQVNTLDYNIIGLSYYPMWHGKSLDNLKTNMRSLSETHNKKVLIAETAYPFTLGWNDWTNNIVGLNEHLILPQYPATPEGQSDFIAQIRTLTNEVENGIGFCYWGAELIAWKGDQATDASPWENQALFDFTNNALPVLEEFKFE